MKSKENADEELKEKAAAKEHRATLEKVESEAKAALDRLLNKIGNIVHQSVPVSKDEVRKREHTETPILFAYCVATQKLAQFQAPKLFFFALLRGEFLLFLASTKKVFRAWW